MRSVSYLSWRTVKIWTQKDSQVLTSKLEILVFVNCLVQAVVVTKQNPRETVKIPAVLSRAATICRFNESIKMNLIAT